ncbi:CC171 protein, partial [Cephalopterus ornatus]|nr:CC171 protein [Cephalopterus ornatus]
ASLQQLVFEYRQGLHVAEAECYSLGLQLAELKCSFNEMKKDAEKAVSLQEELNTLKLRMITLDNMQEELNNALQHEHEARMLLQEQEQQINELNYRLQMHSSETADKGQDLNQSKRSLPETAMDMRRRDQKRLLTKMEQDRRQLQERVRDAETDRLLIITHMKAVEAALQLVREEALMQSADAATTEFCLELPRLRIEALSDKEPRGRPEAIAFQVRV